MSTVRLPLFLDQPPIPYVLPAVFPLFSAADLQVARCKLCKNLAHHYESDVSVR